MMKRLPAVLALCFVLVPSCANTTATYYFNGYVYDGLTGERLTDYTIDLIQGDETTKGKVKDGRFSLGPLRQRRDYSVVVKSAGYRPFESTNHGMNGTTYSGADVGDEHQYRELMLFKQEQPSPAARLRILLSDSAVLASGTVQLRPVETVQTADYNNQVNSVATALGDDGNSAIIAKRWFNSLDLQAGVVVKDFADGAVQLEAGELQLGVTYDVRIFAVVGYAMTASMSFLAGATGEVLVTLDRLDNAELRIVDASNRLGGVQSNGRLVLTFNYDIELDTRTSQTLLDDREDAALRAFSGFPFDALNEVSGQLKDATPASVQRGVSVRAVGNQLVFSVAKLDEIFGAPLTAPAALVGISYDLTLPLVQRKGFPSQPKSLTTVTVPSDYTLSGDVVVKASE